jgi:hypothetical protein
MRYLWLAPWYPWADSHNLLNNGTPILSSIKDMNSLRELIERKDIFHPELLSNIMEYILKHALHA